MKYILQPFSFFAYVDKKIAKASRKTQIVNTFALKAFLSLSFQQYIDWNSPGQGVAFICSKSIGTAAVGLYFRPNLSWPSLPATSSMLSVRVATKLLVGAFIACTQPREPISQASPGRDTKCQSQGRINSCIMSHRLLDHRFGANIYTASARARTFSLKGERDVTQIGIVFPPTLARASTLLARYSWVCILRAQDCTA